MRQKLLPTLIVVIIVLIAFLHHRALAHSLYWVYDWFDIMMHFLGGFWIGLVVLWLWYCAHWCGPRTCRPGMMLGQGVVSALVVGLGWELFELWAGIAVTDELFSDTLLDLVMDGLGGLTAALLVMLIIRKTQLHEQ